MKKNALSLSELIVALGVLAVLTAIMIPMMSNMTTDREKHRFIAAYNILENAVNDMITDEAIYPSGSFTNTISASFFCDNFANTISTVVFQDCTSVPPVNFPVNIQMSNGVTWAGVRVEGNFTNATRSNQIEIWTRKDGPHVEGEDVFLVTIFDDGRLYVDTQKGREYLDDI